MQQDYRILDNLEKTFCQSCGKNIRYYCSDCVLSRPELLGKIPRLELPMQVCIWKHPKENSAKSTGVHAKLLAPNSVHIWTMAPLALEKNERELEMATMTSTSTSKQNSQNTQCFDPVPFNRQSTLVLYPCAESKSLSEYHRSGHAYDTLLVLEGTWSQSLSMNRCLASLPRVHLDANIQTKFWRHQDIGRHCTSTIEAIYYFFKTWSDIDRNDITCSILLRSSSSSWSKEYDFENLLFFFHYYYHRIQESYRNDPEKKYHPKHVQDYIKRPNVPLQHISHH